MKAIIWDLKSIYAFVNEVWLFVGIQDLRQRNFLASDRIYVVYVLISKFESVSVSEIRWKLTES